jgi:hypothetical protein
MGLRRLARLRATAVSAVMATTDASDRDRRIGFVVIEAQNLWGNFARAYVLSCIVSPRRRRGGCVKLGNSAIRLPGDVLHLAARASKGPHAPAPTSRREEPPWHDTSVLLKTCEGMKCSHLADVHAALSTQTRALYDLPVFRNFYAHRNQESAEKAIRIARQQYLIAGVSHPTEALAQPALQRPQALVLDWLDEIEVIMDFLCD